MTIGDVVLQRDAPGDVLVAPLAVRRRAGPEAEGQPSAADALHAGGRRSEHRGMAIGDVGDQRAETDRASSLRRARRAT